MPVATARLLPVLLLLAGCAKPQVLHVDDAPRPERAPEQVQLLLEEPDRPFRTVGLIRSTPVGLFRDMDHLKREVRAAAAKLGADAVILGMVAAPASSASTTTDGEGGVAIAVSSSEKLRLFGRAIVYRD